MEHDNFKRAASVTEVQARGMTVVEVDGQTICLVYHDGRVYAVDNRCPHMGFPLHKGSCKDGILTCHWHHARFDLASGGTFDPFADDVRAYCIRIDGDEVYVDTSEPANLEQRQFERLADGLRQDISLVIAKSLTTLLSAGADPVKPFQIGLEYGSSSRGNGWGSGLTVLVCMMNLLPALDPDDRPRALYHGLSFVAGDTAGSAPQIATPPLPSSDYDFVTLKRWYREFVEMYNTDGAKRCVVTAAHIGVGHAKIAEMLFSAATDHRYVNTGHSLDFANKALEALDIAGWQLAEPVLLSLVRLFADRGVASRMEDSDQWRRPQDLVAILERGFAALPGAIESGRSRYQAGGWRERLTPHVLGDDPQRAVDSLLEALAGGCAPEELAATVAYAAAMRIAQFRVSNDFGDWVTVAHTFIFASAVHQAVRRTDSPEILRGVFDAAISIYTDRFLNTPPARLPEPGGSEIDTAALLQEMPALLDRTRQVNEAGELAGRYLYGGGSPSRLMAMLGNLLLREDRDFHTIQVVEAAFRQYSQIEDKTAGIPLLVAAARYLAAHAPTDRMQGQTFQTAQRLQRRENLFEE